MLVATAVAPTHLGGSVPLLLMTYTFALEGFLLVSFESGHFRYVCVDISRRALLFGGVSQNHK